MMENGNEIETTDEERPPINPPRGRQYRPVGSHDRAVIQMASMEPGSTSDIPLRFSVHPFHAKCLLYIIYQSVILVSVSTFSVFSGLEKPQISTVKDTGIHNN